jgi:hypothetical protein
VRHVCSLINLYFCPLSDVYVSQCSENSQKNMGLSGFNLKKSKKGYFKVLENFNKSCPLLS